MTEAYAGETVCCEAYWPAGAALIVSSRPEADSGFASRVRVVLARHGAQVGYRAESAGVTRESEHRVPLDPQQALRLDRLLTDLRALDGVAGVYANGQIPQ
jgi:transcriptional/translational regulatory protein YebC/TACO1